MTTSTVRTRLIVAGVGMCVVAGLGGCSSSRHEQVLDDPTPNLDTLYQRPEDVDNAMAVTIDENDRMFWQDMGRLFLFDRPSRLAREPIPRP